VGSATARSLYETCGWGRVCWVLTAFCCALVFLLRVLFFLIRRDEEDIECSVYIFVLDVANLAMWGQKEG